MVPSVSYGSAQHLVYSPAIVWWFVGDFRTFATSKHREGKFHRIPINSAK